MISEREEIVRAKLAASRAKTLALADSMTDEDWNRPAYAEDEDSDWRMIDILRHVADSERGMTALIVQIKDGGEGVPVDFDLNRWNQRAVSKLQEKSAGDLIAAMSVNRDNLLALIDSLKPSDWDKKGRHASLKVMTIEEVCHLIADHEEAHAESIQLGLTG